MNSFKFHKRVFHEVREDLPKSLPDWFQNLTLVSAIVPLGSKVRLSRRIRKDNVDGTVRRVGIVPEFPFGAGRLECLGVGMGRCLTHSFLYCD